LQPLKSLFAIYPQVSTAIHNRYEIPLIELLASPCNQNDPAQQALFDFDDPLSF